MPTGNENEKRLLAMCEAIKRLRVDKGMSIAQMSHTAHVPPQTIEDLENHVIPDDFTVGSLVSLHGIFHLPISDFFIPPEA